MIVGIDYESTPTQPRVIKNRQRIACNESNNFSSEWNALCRGSSIQEADSFLSP